MESGRLQRERKKDELSSKEQSVRTSSAATLGSPLTFNDTRPAGLRLGQGFGSSATAHPVQAKLTVNEPGDQYEQEADRVAEQVIRMPDPSLRLQRKCGCDGASSGTCEQCAEESLVQRQIGSADSSSSIEAPAIVHDALRSPAVSLDSSTRSFMESRFGHDFSHVRVHTDARANEAAQAVRARAYTVGSHLVFASGQYSPRTNEGRRLLAHELTHTMQQGSTKVPRKVQRQFTPAAGQLGRETGRVTPADPQGVLRIDLDRTTACGNVYHLQLHFDRRNCTVISPRPVRFVHPNDATKRLPAAAFNALAERFISVANTRLNGWYAIRIAGTEPGCAAACRDREMPIQVQVSRSSDHNAYPITLINDSERSSSRTLHAGDVDEWMLWHEAGHVALGISDEYHEAGVACREGSHATENDWSLMASHDDFRARAVMHPRHFSHILTWFQREYSGCRVTLPALARATVFDTLLHLDIGGGTLGGSRAGSLGLAFQRGFPLDAARRFRLLAGARFSALSTADRAAILAGITVGIDASTNRSAGGFQAGADVSVGAGAMWPTGLKGVTRPWESGGTGVRGIAGVEGSAHLGYAGPMSEFGLFGRAGALFGERASNTYFLVGVRFGFNL